MVSHAAPKKNTTRRIASGLVGAALFVGLGAALAPVASATVSSDVTDHQNIIGDFGVSRQAGTSKMDSTPVAFKFDVDGNLAPLSCFNDTYVSTKGQDFSTKVPTCKK